MSPNVVDVFKRFVAAGNTTEPIIVNDDRTRFLGYPLKTWSTMVSTTTTTASKIAIFADWQAAYQVVDRLGITAELIPHLFGAAQGNLPTGQRGLYVYGRTGAAPLVPNAARYLEVK
jgi:HK97 family phage major capsid protein